MKQALRHLSIPIHCLEPTPIEIKLLRGQSSRKRRNAFSNRASNINKGVGLGMRRLLANLALASILSIFVLPLAASLQQPGLPLCCRPGGKHHCMENSPKTGFKSKIDTCPYASHAIASPVTALQAGKFETGGPAVGGFVCLMQASSGYRIAGRRLSDRGPPALPR